MNSSNNPESADRAAEVADLVARTGDFVREIVLPVEDAHDGDIERAGGDAMRRELQAAARERGLLTPHAPVEYGGRALTMSERARVFEAAGYGLFGGMAINAAAPDEGNLHLLDHVATPDQRDQYLAPLARAEARSAFAMTEPAPGARRPKPWPRPASTGRVATSGTGGSTSGWLT